MITINLFDYRDILKKVRIQMQVSAAVGVIGATLLLIVASWIIEEVSRDDLKIKVEAVEGKIKALDGKVQTVVKMQNKQKRIDQIVNGITTLKTGQMLSMTQLLEDLGKSLPEGIWLEEVQQSKWQDLEKNKVPVIFIKDPAEKPKPGKGEELSNFITIKGRTYSDVNLARFIESLEKVPYFKTVFLFKSTLSEEKLDPTHRFTVYCYMGEIKATT